MTKEEIEKFEIALENMEAFMTSGFEVPDDILDSVLTGASNLITALREAEQRERWISVDDECPAIGQKVILFDNGVVQEEIYTMDAHDVSDYTMEYFWSRDDLDECPPVKSGQYWMSLPAAIRGKEEA